jgi:exosortase A
MNLSLSGVRVAIDLPAGAWRRLAPGLLMTAAVLLIFHDTAAAMVEIWIRSETFAHAFLVPPIVAWLIWRRREALARLPVRPQPWLLLPVALACLVWLLGELVGVNTGTQLALVALIVLGVPALYGIEVTLALLFPLLFLFFAVPIGEFMVPSMMEWTANFTVTALQWSGVPVYREGLQFVIPSGSWSVIEACSGVRYLIASFMVGTLFANLNFQSAGRRIAFMAVSLAVPLVANWLRAYLIVMLGHLSGNRLATGVDHIIYGWLFFGIVIGAMFFIGARWAQPEQPVSRPALVPAAPGPADVPDAPWHRGWPVALAMLVLMLVTQAAFLYLGREHAEPAPALALPDSVSGWTASDTPLASWEPVFDNARRVVSRSYDSPEARAGLWLGYYRDQDREHKLVSSTHGMVAALKDAVWAQTRAGQRELALPGGAMPLLTGDLRGSVVPGADRAPRLRVWQTYWVGGRFMTGDVRTRLAIALNRLAGQGDDSAVIFFYTPLPESATAEDEAAADAVLARFVAAQIGPLRQALDAARQAP